MKNIYENILNLLENYKKAFPEDIEVEKYFKYLEENKDCINRKNFNGHITVSGFVVNNNKTLLLWHKALKRLQQPGGHIDPPDQSVFDGAIREVKEETGLDTELVEGKYKNIPITLEIHKIPENKNKEEVEHYHFDIMILLKLKNDKQQISNTDDGAEGARFVEFSGIKKENNPYIFKTIQKYLETEHG